MTRRTDDYAAGFADAIEKAAVAADDYTPLTHDMTCGREVGRTIEVAIRALTPDPPAPPSDAQVEAAAGLREEIAQAGLTAWVQTGANGAAVITLEELAVISPEDYMGCLAMADAVLALPALRSSEERARVAEAERDEARAKLAFLVDHATYSDSYGVPGSDFTCCHFCQGGGAPNIPFKHDDQCPVLKCEDAAADWWHEQEEVREDREALTRRVAELEGENDKLRSMLANGSDPCVYCGLAKADMARCSSGFPGCGRADDMMLGDAALLTAGEDDARG